MATTRFGMLFCRPEAACSSLNFLLSLKVCPFTCSQDVSKSLMELALCHRTLASPDIFGHLWRNDVNGVTSSAVGAFQTFVDTTVP